MKKKKEVTLEWLRSLGGERNLKKGGVCFPLDYFGFLQFRIDLISPMAFVHCNGCVYELHFDWTKEGVLDLLRTFRVEVKP